MFIDSHCHIYKEYYDNIDEVINLSLNNKVNRFLDNGTDYNSNKEIVKLVGKYPSIYGALGIHPEASSKYNEEDIKYIEDNLTNPKIIAVGEIGLDYHYENYNKDEQIKLFRMQLKLAEKYDMPVVIHSRDATLDTINILKEYKVTGVIHSFSGSLETAKEYIKMGFLIGVNGVITFKNAHIKDVIKEIPIDKILLETDSPYLTPEPFRGTKNDPSHILDIAKFVADLKGISMDELSTITNNNFDKLYLNK